VTPAAAWPSSPAVAGVRLPPTPSQPGSLRLAAEAGRDLAPIMAAAAALPMLRLPVWCVIGDVLNPAKAASRVVTHLERHGKTVYCVNPSTKTVETETLKRSLSALPAMPDVIDLIINPAVGAEQMRAAAELGISNVFVQPVRACVPCV
jgi:hypothetical protein